MMPVIKGVHLISGQSWTHLFQVYSGRLTREFRLNMHLYNDCFFYFQERERQALNTSKRKALSNVYQPPDDDDDNNRGPPGSCGSGPGFTTPFNRFVF